MSMLLQGFPGSPPMPPDFPGPQEVIVRTDPSILQTMPPPVQFMVILFGMIAVAVVLYPLVRAVARRIERGGQPDIDIAEIDDLRQRVAELEQRQSHVRELEERVDFAERLLAERNRDGIRIERGGGNA